MERFQGESRGRDGVGAECRVLFLFLSVISVLSFESVAILAQVFVFLALPIQIKPHADSALSLVQAEVQGRGW